MLGFLSKIFGGSKSEKDVKQLLPIVQRTNQFYQEYQSLSNDELRAKTAEFKERIKTHLSDIDTEIEKLTNDAEALSTDDIGGRDTIFQVVDKLKKQRNERIEEALESIQAEAFAVVKETARRFTQNTELEATATEHDRALSVTRQHIKIEGDKVTFSNTWLAAGIPVTWNMIHYDVQLIGGSVLHEGKIAEMATGEGKTLVSTLPAYLNALAGEGVHIVTVNDYLAKRD